MTHRLNARTSLGGAGAASSHEDSQVAVSSFQLSRMRAGEDFRVKVIPVSCKFRITSLMSSLFFSRRAQNLAGAQCRSK